LTATAVHQARSVCRAIFVGSYVVAEAAV